MGYAIELSFDIKKYSLSSEHLDKYRQCAKDLNCTMQYFMNEMEGFGKRTIRSDNIHVVNFEELENLLEFIKIMRREPRNYIECIYQDDISCDLLYASPKYIRKMGRDLGKEFKKKQKLYVPKSDIEIKIYNAMKKK